MTKQVLSTFFSAARGVLGDWRSLVALALLYAALVAAAVVFVTTREASLFQIGVTAVAAALVPVLFFAMASAAASYAVGESRTLPLVRRALRGFLKVVLVSIPLLALVVGAVWAMNKLENKVRHEPNEEASVSYPADEGSEDESGAEEGAAERRPKPRVRWAYVAVSALRLLLLGVVLPLLALHLWLVAVRDGLRACVTRLHRTLARALSARSVFIYALGMIFFALLPYFLVIKRTPVSAGWLELSLLGIRLAAAFAFTLTGFLATARALARIGADAATDGATAPQPDTPPRVAEPASVTS